ncbi:MAG: hypothetical protein AB7N76_05335 [Planctomycetota bacterium]
MALVQHPRCPYCHGQVQPHERKTACDQCMTWYHEECWKELGRCASCNAAGAVAPKADGAPKQRRPQRQLQPRVALPQGMTLEEDGGGLRIAYRWFTWSTLFLTFFCVFWDGFLCFWYGMASTMFAKDGVNGPGLIFFLFPLIHVAVGAGLTYFVLCSYLNRTTIAVRGDELSIRHGPLPWFGNQDLRASDLAQLYCTQEISRGSKGGTSISYSLHALDQRQRKTKLLSGLQDADQVRFIEQELERHLGIEDQPVRGELG